MLLIGMVELYTALMMDLYMIQISHATVLKTEGQYLLRMSIFKLPIPLWNSTLLKKKVVHYIIISPLNQVTAG